MTAGPRTIDLGVIPPVADEDAEPPWYTPWPGWSWLRRAVAGRTWWGITAGTVLLLLTTAAAATPAPPRLVPHATVPVAGALGEDWLFVLTERTLYVGYRSDAGPPLSAYHLRDGSLRWEAERSEGSSLEVQGGLLGADDVPVLSSTMAADDLSWPRASVLDPETGAERWSTEGQRLEIMDDWMFVRRERPVAPDDADPRATVPWARYTLAVLRAETGEEVLTLPSMHDGSWDLVRARPGAGAGRLVTLGEGGLRSYDLATAAPVATADGPPVSHTARLTVAGDLLLVQADSAVQRFHAYDVDTLDHRWTRDITTSVHGFSGCGQVVCVNRLGTRPQAIDPATGALAWSADWYPAPDYYAIAPGPPWPSDALLAGDWVVDAGTGEPVIELLGWEPANARSAAVDDPIMVTRPDPGTEDGIPRTWLGRLHLDPPGVEVLGAIAHDFASGEVFGAGCQVGFGYAACADGQRIQLWRVR